MWYISDDMPTGFGIEVKTNEPLKIYTTFKIGGPARFFTSVRNEDEVRQAYGFWREQSLGETPFVLGGGSNILVSDHGVDTLVIHMANEGISLASEDAGSVTLSIAAGEPWDNVVRYAVEHGWWGIENLSHIPGQAGAALVQNIGAYGQQISDVLKTAEVMDTEIRQVMSLAAAECEFGYRKSIFNSTRKNRYLILGLVLTLKKQGRRNLSYPDVQSYFEARHMNRPGLAEIRNAIIEIRDRKFPFPKEERGGNAGSFSKTWY